MKRLLDVVLSSVMLLVSSPVWLVIAVAIKLDSRGPVFYTQERWGWHGERFTLYKFRSMHVAEPGAAVMQAVVDDPRVTRVGRVIRRMGLDELPQLINIWRGDMSFVGPRALAVGETVELEPGTRVAYEDIPEFSMRSKARPGLTGMATIYLPKDAPPSQKFSQDLAYVEQASMWLDIKLIALSFVISFRGRWETRDPKL